MARRIATCLLAFTMTLVAAHLPGEPRLARAQEAEMDAAGEAQAKEALRLYKQGRYEEAAEIFAKLSVDYPTMLVFERNLGACFYYLGKPGPAISNLRRYLSRKQDIEPDDKATVERWISEMEKLREQNAAAAAPPAVPMPAEGAPSAPSPAAVEPSATAQPSLPPLPPPLPTPVSAMPAPPPEPPAQPAGIDLTSHPPQSRADENASPFYAKWWFWGAVGVVAAGSVTAYLLASRGATQNACSGSKIPCDAIK
jgi:hypothetical protein